MFQTIGLVKDDGKLAVITFRQESHMNVLSLDFIRELNEALEEVRSDRDVKVVILTGMGKAFCCGADARYFSGEMRLNELEVRSYLKAIVSLFESIESFEKPTIAAINGYALGGGCEMAISCDFRVIAEQGRIGVPEIRLATLAGAGGTMRLPRLVGLGKAIEMNLLGTHLSAEEALRIGLVHRIATGESLMEEARNLGLKLAENSAIAMYMIKAAIRQSIYGDKQSSIEYAMQCMLSLYEHADQKAEAIPAFFEKRTPYFEGVSFGLPKR